MKDISKNTQFLSLILCYFSKPYLLSKINIKIGLHDKYLFLSKLQEGINVKKEMRDLLKI